MDSSQRVSHKTIKVYLAAIRLSHLEQDMEDPTDDELLHLVCRGIRRMQGEASCRTRLPITINILCTLKMQLRSSDNYSPAEKHLLWAAFTLAFYGFLRASELTSSSQTEFSPPGLHWCNITAQPSILTITLRQSKTDPFRRGHSISISATNSSTCPVKAFHKYMNFVSPQCRHGPVFNIGRFRPLTRSQVTSVVRQLLLEAGVDYTDYASHSFRIGAATTAAAAGIPSDLIRTLGRWRSNAYQRYIQYPTAQLAAVPSLLSQTDASNQVPWNADSIS